MIQYSILSTEPTKIKCDCLVVAIYNDTLSEEAQAIDIALNGEISQLASRSGLKKQKTGIACLYNPPAINAKQLILMQLGSTDDLDANKWNVALTGLLKKIHSMPIKSITLGLSSAKCSTTSILDHVQMVTKLTDNVDYHYDTTKSEKASKSLLERISLHLTSSQNSKAAKTGMRYGVAISKGIKLSKQLSNLPANICTPSYLAEQATQLALSHGLKTKILDEKQMDKLGMHCLLSVSKGSSEPAKFIIMHYSGAAKNQAPVVLVGKGLTFDSGGISIKPAAKMDEMKYDMCGGASVFGTLAAVSEMKLAVNLIGIVPSCENLINGKANKPGDVITGMSKKTVEVLNTDAEGRLILSDALTYVERFKPALVIDVATLTGACVIALGAHASALMANDQSLANEIIACGEQSQDRVWQLPLWDDYQKQLDSNFADIANIGGREAGAITAACFLSRFTEKYPWAHLDIAGTAWQGGTKKGATGRPVSLLSQILIKHSNKAA